MVEPEKVTDLGLSAHPHFLHTILPVERRGGSSEVHLGQFLSSDFGSKLLSIILKFLGGWRPDFRLPSQGRGLIAIYTDLLARIRLA